MSPELEDEWSRRLSARRGGADGKRCGQDRRAADHRASDLRIRDTRNRLARGAGGIDAVRGLLPAAVLAYIERNQLYHSRPDAT